MIKSSAPHIYHSALELSPRDSIVRQNYYQWSWEHPTPQVVCGISQSWDHPAIISGDYVSYTWSPCGQFFSTQTSTSVEVWDSLTLEKHSSLQSIELGEVQYPLHHTPHALSYSPDGHSMVGFFGSSIIIWDIQTGGVAKEIQCSDTPRSLVWSLDGQAIGAIFPAETETYWVAYTYDVNSGVRMSTDMLQSLFQPYLWSHNKSFQAMTIPDSSNFTVHIKIFEIWPIFGDIASFSIKLDLCYGNSTMSFSPAVYWFSAISNNSSSSSWNTLVVLDIQSSKVFLKTTDCFSASYLSPDGSLLMASTSFEIKIWKYSSDKGYTQWRVFPVWGGTMGGSQGCQFSPTSSSLLISRRGFLEVKHLDGPNISSSGKIDFCDVFSTDGTFVVIAPYEGKTVTVTNLNKINLQSIEPGFIVQQLALTNNVLLVQGDGQLAGWQLMGGMVDKVLDDGAMGQDGRLWTKHVPKHHPRFWVGSSIGVLESSGEYLLCYNTETGEELGSIPVEVPSPSAPSWKCFNNWHSSFGGQYSFSYHKFSECEDPSKDNLLVSIPWYEEGWVKYPVGKYWHKFWLPVHWRPQWHTAHWLDSVTTLRIRATTGLVIIKFHSKSPPH